MTLSVKVMQRVASTLLRLEENETYRSHARNFFNENAMRTWSSSIAILTQRERLFFYSKGVKEFHTMKTPPFLSIILSTKDSNVLTCTK